MVDNQDAAAALFPERVGDRLRAARLAAGMDLPDVANKTRVPLRHLQALESCQYDALPGATYCIGFAKAFARTVGLDEAQTANELRDELRDLNLDHRAERIEYQVADATRLPSRTLAWVGIAVAVLIASGYAVIRYYRSAPSDPAIEAAALADDNGTVEAVGADDLAPPGSETGATPAPTVGTGEVVLTATNAVWLRVYDASDKVLFEKEMATGERYVVPADANEPKIRTGRADLITVTIDGNPVPALGPAERTIKDVGISAAALKSRSSAPEGSGAVDRGTELPANPGTARP